MSINLCIFTTALMLFLTVDILLCGILDGVGWHPERLLRTGQCQEDGGHEDRPIHGAGPGPGLTGGTGCTSLPLDCPRNLPQSLLSISNPSQLKIIAELSQLHGGIYLWWSN